MAPKRANRARNTGQRANAAAAAAAAAAAPISQAQRQQPPPPTATDVASSGAVAGRGRNRHVPFDPNPKTSPLYRLTPKSPKLVAGIALWYAILAGITLVLHYKLPTPITIAQSNALATSGKPPSFSEQNARSVMTYLSEHIGYRIVGTREHVQAEDWLWDRVNSKVGWYPNLVAADADVPHRNSTRGDRLAGVEVEAWRQIDDGSHRFDFMSSIVQKKYYGMSNVIVRLSDGTDQGKEHAVLVNAHLDSTLPSPGAADDGMAIGVLDDLIRVLTTGPLPDLYHSIILLFNNGEESLQDASHLYSTKHETVKSVRGVINLEACGVTGPELLFQATSEVFLDAYAQVPHPFGTVLANDVFATGLILSDTDFRQFVQYANLTGLDMAVIGDSYLYHTRRDIPEHIPPGVIQHMGDNVLSLVRYLAANNQTSDKLPSVDRATSLHEMPYFFTLAARYFVLLKPGLFRSISMGSSAWLNFATQSIAQGDKPFQIYIASIAAFLGTIFSVIAAILSSNVVASLMTYVLGRPLSWFTHPWAPLLLYLPPAIAGVLAVQHFVPRMIKEENRPYMERASLTGMTFVFTFALLIANVFSVGSAYLALLAVFMGLSSMAWNDIYQLGITAIDLHRIPVDQRMHWSTYLIMALVPATVGLEGLTTFLDLFTPLTGRTGEDAPADHIIATIVGGMTVLSVPVIIPLSHRFGAAARQKVIQLLLGVSVLAIAIFATLNPFDQLHPQRLFVHQTQNLTSGEWLMNLGGADPHAESLFKVIRDAADHTGYVGEPPVKVEMHPWNPDFDPLYPVSQFIAPYKYRLPAPSEGVTHHPEFRITVTREHFDWDAATRNVTLHIEHPGLIWSVVAFDAELLAWDVGPTPPPAGLRRHHIKEVSRFGITSWDINLLIQLTPESAAAAKARGNPKNFQHLVQVAKGDDPYLYDPSRLRVDFTALDESGMYPQKAPLHQQGNHAHVDTFASLDAYLLEAHPEVDAMLLPTVAGVALA